jgi:hypothetical protein
MKNQYQYDIIKPAIHSFRVAITIQHPPTSRKKVERKTIEIGPTEHHTSFVGTWYYGTVLLVVAAAASLSQLQLQYGIHRKYCDYR